MKDLLTSIASVSICLGGQIVYVVKYYMIIEFKTCEIANRGDSCCISDLFKSLLKFAYGACIQVRCR